MHPEVITIIYALCKIAFLVAKTHFPWKPVKSDNQVLKCTARVLLKVPQSSTVGRKAYS